MGIRTPSNGLGLVGENARAEGIDQPWEQDNQAWWDWYVSLADNADEDVETSVDVPDLPAIDMPRDDAIVAELSEPYPLSEQDCARFQRDGSVKLSNVLSPAAVMRLRMELKQLLERAFQTSLDGGAQDRFFSLDMTWLDNPLIKAYVLSPRIAKISADLLGAPRVRLYHDNVLSKEPGCGRTPWHYDDHHFPLASNDVVTAWIPAQPIPAAMGPLAFAKPLNVYQLVEDIPFNKFDTSYDRRIAEVFKSNNVAVDDAPFAIGDVSFHHNLSFHTAAGNRTRRSRIVLANTYYADGARILDRPTMVSGDWQKFIPGAGPGDLAASELNPVCWPAETK